MAVRGKSGQLKFLLLSQLLDGKAARTREICDVDKVKLVYAGSSE